MADGKRLKKTDCCFDKDHSVSRASSVTPWKGSNGFCIADTDALEIQRELLETVELNVDFLAASQHRKLCSSIPNGIFTL